MKKAFAILSAAVILVSSMSNAVIFAGFKLNQAEIERLYCVNKAKPQKNCHGKCHLERQLAENNSNDGQPTPSQTLEQNFKITFFHQQVMQVSSIAQLLQKLPLPDCCDHFILRLFGKSIFQPPDLQPA